MKKLYPLSDLSSASGIPMSSLSGRLGITGSTWQGYVRDGVSELVGDRMAVKLGLNAYAVWPEMIDDAVEAASLTCANERCARLFLPADARQRYCRSNCRMAAWRRRKYASDADFREARKAEAAAYYAEAGDYARARQRRYYSDHVADERERARRNRSKSDAA